MFARDGYTTIALVLLLGAGSGTAAVWFIDHWLRWPVLGAIAAFVGLVVYFFRDPDRDIPEDPDALLSPADGKVVLIKEVDEEVFLKDKAIQISIFLSPLDVHVNRVPASGSIAYVKYHPGVYLMAWDERSSTMNERADFGLVHTSGTKILFRQITGFLARRIVYRLEEGHEVSAGERFGIMKFGSRMDILVPTSMNLNIKEGDRTVAGETLMGSFDSVSEDIPTS